MNEAKETLNTYKEIIKKMELDSELEYHISNHLKNRSKIKALDVKKVYSISNILGYYKWKLLQYIFWKYASGKREWMANWMRKYNHTNKFLDMCKTPYIINRK